MTSPGLGREDSFESRRLRELDEEMRELAAKMERSRGSNQHWKEKLAQRDVGPALETARFLLEFHFPGFASALLATS